MLTPSGHIFDDMLNFGGPSAGVYYWSWSGPAKPSDPWNPYAAWGLQYAEQNGWLAEWLHNGTAEFLPIGR